MVFFFFFFFFKFIIIFFFFCDIFTEAEIDDKTDGMCDISNSYSNFISIGFLFLVFYFSISIYLLLILSYLECRF